MLHLHAVVLLVLLLLILPHSGSDAPSAAVMPAHSRAQMHSAAVGRFFGRSIAEINRTQRQLWPLQPDMDKQAIRRAVHRHADYGDAGHRSRRYCVHEMRGMNVNDTELVLDALTHESWLYTASGANTLQQRLRAATGRSIAESTINDAVRAMNWTSKDTHRVHPGRDAVASAQVRVDLAAYPLKCITSLDATKVNSGDFQRGRGRAPRGEQAEQPTRVLPGDGENRCLYAAMNIDGMVTDACAVITGNITNEVFMEWVYEYLLPMLRRYRSSACSSASTTSSSSAESS
jgi:hypothetical protein